jgi:hypothetical protein
MKRFQAVFPNRSEKTGGTMRKFQLVLLFILTSLSPLAQDIQHESVVVNIEIPVRIFKGGQFIQDLKLEDFILLEDGVPQQIESLYLVKKNYIRRKEFESMPPGRNLGVPPDVSRRFVLVFEMQEYLPQINQVLDHFFQDVIRPGDSLVVITPRKTYNLTDQAVRKQGGQRCADNLKSILRKEITMSGAEYHSLVQDIVRTLTNDPNWNFAYMGMQLEDLYQQWLQLKSLSERNLLRFAEYLKGLNGQKHMFLFYQVEVLPQFKKAAFSFRSGQGKKEHYYWRMYDIFQYYNRDIGFDFSKIERAFSDSSISSHFLYLTNRRMYEMDISYYRTTFDSLDFAEKTGEIFAAFKELADSTGGIAESSWNAAAAFRKAVDASEDYYLLYYKPKGYRSDGKFRKIEVHINQPGFKILHRAGYIAD